MKFVKVHSDIVTVTMWQAVAKDRNLTYCGMDQVRNGSLGRGVVYVGHFPVGGPHYFDVSKKRALVRCS